MDLTRNESSKEINVALPDEIDVGRYLRVLTRWWRVIVLCTVLGAVIPLASSFTASKMYQAESRLAMVRSGTVVSFDTKIRTVSDTDPTSLNNDPATRRKSLVTLGESSELALAVANKIGDQLPERLRDPAVLTRIVKVTNDGDLFLVQATTNDPALSALVANTWAELYRDQVNTVYSENPLNLEALSGQVSSAKKNYEAAQAAVVDFVNTSPLDKLTRQQNLLVSQLDTQVAIQAKLIQLKSEATALRQRIASGGGDSSNGDELASLLLEASAFSNGAQLPVNLQVALNQFNASTTTVDRLAQLDSLIAAMQARQQALQNDQQQALLQQLNEVKSQLEHTVARQRELVSARDLEWTTYQSLVNQQAASNITSEAKGQWLRLATLAVPPTEATGMSRLILGLIGAVVGLALGILLAFLLEFLASGLSSPERVRETLHLPTLAVFPELPLSVDPDMPGNAVVAEELRRLRYTLFSQQAYRAIAVTSAVSYQDAGALAVNLAVVAAQAGKRVLLIDANLWTAPLHSLFHLERAQGLVEALDAIRKDNSIAPYIKASRVEGVSLVTAGVSSADPAALLDAPAFRTLVTKVQQDFEIVILNTPPILEVVDPIIIAQAADGLVLVLDGVNTSPATARRVKARLEDAQVSVFGVVLSHNTDTSRTETAGTTSAAHTNFWSGMRMRVLGFLGPNAA